MAPRRLKPLVVCGNLQLPQWPENGGYNVRLRPGLNWEVAWLGDSVPKLPSYAEQAASRSQRHSLVYSVDRYSAIKYSAEKYITSIYIP